MDASSSLTMKSNEFFEKIHEENKNNPPTSYISLLETSASLDDETDGRIFSSQILNWSTTFHRLKQIGSTTIQLTRQFFQQRFTQIQRTEDLQIEQNIQLLQESKCSYQKLFKQIKSISAKFSSIIEIEKSFDQSLNEIQRISIKSEDLIDQIVRHNQCHKVLITHNEKLLNSLNLFLNKLETLINVTMEDTFQTMKIYENARNQYDIDRYNYQRILNRYEEQQISTVSSLTNHEENLFRNYRTSEEFYQKMKENLLIKIKLLDQNRVLVISEKKKNESFSFIFV